MAAEVFINEKSSGKLLSHIIINPILSEYPQLTSTFVTSFFSAVQQKSFLPLTFLQFEKFSLSFDSNDQIQLIVASRSSSSHYLRAFTRQVLLLSRIAISNQSVLEQEWNRVHFRILEQLTLSAKKLNFVRGAGLFLSEKVDDKSYFLNSYRGSAEMVKICFDEKDDGIFWIGQDMAFKANNVILVVQFDKNAVFEQIGDGEEIQRGRCGIVDFPGSQEISIEVQQIANSCKECLEMIV